MTLDQYRTGAALVRRLTEGDLEARFPLSDFLEEFGMPNRSGEYASENALVWTLRELRLDGDKTPSGHPIAVTATPIGNSFIYCVYRGPKRSAWVGTWPRWAWDGEYN